MRRNKVQTFSELMAAFSSCSIVITSIFHTFQMPMFTTSPHLTIKLSVLWATHCSLTPLIVVFKCCLSSPGLSFLAPPQRPPESPVGVRWKLPLTTCWLYSITSDQTFLSYLPSSYGPRHTNRAQSPKIFVMLTSTLLP